MINCLCVIQSGQSADQRRKQLTQAMNEFAVSRLGDTLAINWLPVSAGNGFTEGKPSSSSVVSLTAREPLDQAQREILLRELVQLWTAHTGSSDHEIVAVIADPTQH